MNDSLGKLLISVPIAVRWGDMDAFNHVNNSVYATYLEEARLRWFNTIQGPWANEQMGPVVASMRIEYRQPIEWPNEVQLDLYCDRAGRSSVSIPFRIVKAHQPDRLYAEGSTILVWIDRLSGKSIELPQYVRAAAV
jgi:acyl-CoA thioester hydrolase